MCTGGERTSQTRLARSDADASQHCAPVLRLRTHLSARLASLSGIRYQARHLHLHLHCSSERHTPCASCRAWSVFPRLGTRMVPRRSSVIRCVNGSVLQRKGSGVQPRRQASRRVDVCVCVCAHRSRHSRIDPRAVAPNCRLSTSARSPRTSRLPGRQHSSTPTHSHLSLIPHALTRSHCVSVHPSHTSPPVLDVPASQSVGRSSALAPPSARIHQQQQSQQQRPPLTPLTPHSTATKTPSPPRSWPP